MPNWKESIVDAAVTDAKNQIPGSKPKYYVLQGTIDGVNKHFTCYALTDASSPMVFKNGSLVCPTDDYVNQDISINFVDAPIQGDKLVIYC